MPDITISKRQVKQIRRIMAVRVERQAIVDAGDPNRPIHNMGNTWIVRDLDKIGRQLMLEFIPDGIPVAEFSGHERVDLADAWWDTLVNATGKITVTMIMLAAPEKLHRICAA